MDRLQGPGAQPRAATGSPHPPATEPEPEPTTKDDASPLAAVHARNRAAGATTASWPLLMAELADRRRFLPAGDGPGLHPVRLGPLLEHARRSSTQGAAAPDHIAERPRQAILPPQPGAGCTYYEALAWVREVYGAEAAADFPSLYRQRGQDPLRVLGWYVDQPTSVQTGLDRNFHQVRHVVDHAQALLPRTGASIAVVGCADGGEALAYAAVAASRGCDGARVLGVDVNPEMLERAHDPEYVYQISHRYPPWEELAEHFEVVRQGRYTDDVRPVPALRGMTHYERLNLLYEPLAALGGGHQVLSLRHVLEHYPPASREAILCNAVSGVVPGGIVVLDTTGDMVVGPADAPRVVGSFRPMKPEYTLWRHALAQPKEALKYGLRPLPSDALRPADCFQRC